MDECFAYDHELRARGHAVGGEVVQSARDAVTVRWSDRQVLVTDGPYAECKEQLGGILMLEARDLNQAIQLISDHPGVKAGGFEIRGTDADVEDRFQEWRTRSVDLGASRSTDQ